MEVYIDREQTKAKHYILKKYLQELSFKVLRFQDITYVDGFSGPWKSERIDFSDTSFMIAIQVLKDAQKKIYDQTGILRRIRCFFSENNLNSYRQLSSATASFNRPSEYFEVCTFRGEFEDAIPQIKSFIGSTFPLIFIDPTGWTGYSLPKISPLFNFPKCEVIINFMYDFVNRFKFHPDPKIIASLDPILGGPGWKNRLDPNLEPGLAVEKLFRETLKVAGSFAYVVSTKIEKSTEDRPHFFLAYGTKSRAGLIAFRETEYDALREHARNRSNAKSRKRENRTGSGDLFFEIDADLNEASIDSIVDSQKLLAKQFLLSFLKEKNSVNFKRILEILLQLFVIRETNVKDICVDLAQEGTILNTWAPGARKPGDSTVISIVV